jgi:hypothetical protein
MLYKLKKRRILKKGQIILTDKGFYSTLNYLIGINKYKIVPLIFPKKKPILTVLKDKIQNLLDYFDVNNPRNPIYKALGEQLFDLLPKWEDFRRKRWKIEEFFKFLEIN